MKLATFRLPIALTAAAALAIGAAYATAPTSTATPADTAQANAAPAQPQSQSTPTPGAATTAPEGAAAETTPRPTLGAAQLDQLTAPIALYPDQLLAQILMASTYPLDVVEAARWVRIPANQKLQGERLAEAIKNQNWDPSVMALVPFARILEMMDSKLDWTQRLGNAFLAQQTDVMDSVQRLRRLAMAAGNLKTTPQCHCNVAREGETITITALDSGPVCLPEYNSRLVFGTWPYPAYPPIWFPAPVGFVGADVAFIIGPDFGAFGPFWSWSSINWEARRIAVNTILFNAIAPRPQVFAGGMWTHDPLRGGRAAIAAAAVLGSAATRVAAAHFGYPDMARTWHGWSPVHNAATFHSEPISRAKRAFHAYGPTVHAVSAFHRRFPGEPTSHVGHASAFPHGGGAFNHGGGPGFHGGVQAASRGAPSNGPHGGDHGHHHH